MEELIRLQGARLHNLQNVCVDFPVGKISVVCGPSGCGKSSLVMDTLHAECRRRFLETLNPFLARIAGASSPVPLDSVQGLRPSLSFTSSDHLASTTTIAQLTEIDTLIRPIWVRMAHLFCPQCQQILEVRTRQELVQEIGSLPEGSKIQLWAPLPPAPEQTLQQRAAPLLAQGFTRLRVDTQELWIPDLTESQQQCIPQQLQVVVDRIVIRSQIRSRLADSLEKALTLSGGHVEIWLQTPQSEPQIWFRSLQPTCSQHGVQLPFFNADLLHPGNPQGLYHHPIVRQSQWKDLSWQDFLQTPLENLRPILQELSTDLPEMFQVSSRQILERLQTLDILGLGHLSLERSVETLSDGEILRLRLVPLAGGHLDSLLFCLDEPGAGLHPVDCAKVWQLLQQIVQRGNTMVLLEHQPWMIRQADYLVEMGPGAGEQGGQILSQGATLPPQSPTAQWLQELQEIKKHGPAPRTKAVSDWLTLQVKPFRNLHSQELRIPRGALTTFCGVSGSGKSTLALDLLAQTLQQDPSAHGFQAVVVVDSRSLRTNARSLVCTATDVLTPLRKLLSNTPEAKLRGYKTNRFSPNTAGGRCDSCQGMGVLADPSGFSEVQCPVCQGRRFRDEILDIRLKGLNIADFLDLTIDRFLEIFHAFPVLQDKLNPVQQTGLGYLRLGQSLSHLSGGEQQRLRLSIQLASGSRAQPHLMIFDEPARGLHQQDMGHLIQLFHNLCQQGHTLVTIEHQLSFILESDWIIEMGPGAGKNGGRILVQDSPLNWWQNSHSILAQWHQQSH